MVRIPSEYQEVEYIESTGTQFIELPFGFLDTDEVEIVGAINTTISDKFMIAPKTWNNNANRFAMIGAVYNRFGIGFGSLATTSRPFTPNIANNSYIHTWTYKNRLFSVIKDNEILGTMDVSDITFKAETTELKLFFGFNGCSTGKIASYHHKKANGTEVNLIPCYRKSDNEIGMYDTVSKQFYTNSGTGTFLKGNDVTYDNINLLESRRRILLNTPHIETVSDTIASFKTDVATKLKGCKIHFTPTQEGEGDPSPENVRPIHGWDGITVTKCGKNLAPLFSNTDFWSMAAWFDGNGIIHNNGSYRMCDYKIVSPGKKYVLSTTTMCWKGIGFYDELYNPLKFNQQNAVSIELTCPDNAKYYRVYTFYNGINIQFEEGSIATEYEPYQSTTLTIPFNRTIYGGYVDLVRGEVVETQTKVTLDGNNIKCNYGSYASTNYYGAGWVYANPIGQSYHQNFDRSLYLCDRFALTTTIYETKPHYDYPNAGLLYYIFRILAKTDYQDELTSTQVKDLTNEWLQENPVTIVYPLATPNTYALTPETIKALKGVNNIWSDANGNIEVSFYTH